MEVKLRRNVHANGWLFAHRILEITCTHNAFVVATG